MNWYSLRVISGKEKNVEEHILREAGDNKITNEIEEVFVPYEYAPQHSFPFLKSLSENTNTSLNLFTSY